MPSVTSARPFSGWARRRLLLAAGAVVFVVGAGGCAAGTPIVSAGATTTTEPAFSVSEPPPPPPPTTMRTSARPKPPAPKPKPPAPKPSTTRPPAPYYENCTAARAAGAAPILRGEPGYRRALDADNDGVACESSGGSGGSGSGGTPPPTGGSVYYANCDAARAAGAAPIMRGEPGYRPGLDRDGDGIACE
jgi:hypothetical protein